MPSTNGESGKPDAPLELQEVLYIQTTDGASRPFEVVGILEDPQEHASYAVLLYEPPDRTEGEFIVTDLAGNLLENERLAREIVDEFLAFAQETDDGRSATEETD